MVRYGITTKTKYKRGNLKPERICTCIFRARAERSSLERNDRIEYVIFNMDTGLETW